MTRLWRNATITWFGLFVLAFVNGALREVVLRPLFGIGESLAHQLSCLTGILLWSSFVWWMWPRLKIASLKDAALVGVYWFVLTLLAETFLINKLMGNLTWEQILESYNVAHGEFWGLVLLWVGFLPVVIFKFKKS